MPFLEVLDQRQAKWVRPPPGACVVMVGQTLEAATAGVFLATRHRVVIAQKRGDENARGGNRISLAFQIRGRGDAVLEVESVPVGIRRRGRVAEGIRCVADLMRLFEATHRSVSGHGLSSSEEGPPVKRARAVSPPKIDADARLTIRVQDDTGDEQIFRMRNNCRMEKLMSTYALKVGVNVASFRFYIDGERVNPLATPLELELADGGSIQCFMKQQGD
uniref:Rad60/SUMO-like domain-containing protein n=1 Tax=Octactis speculum TaxID=3111310 RepID=A0A7S2FIU6_9STRA|mmetsp:Transcript_22783/g.31134  ORF Transcript_22783/g.31134 Transcript_22783/m.31134 type:complete len:219 (+) Transcript_22783:482-1138(+)